MELKLFMTPAEEIDLSVLRAKIARLYADAFKRIELGLADPDNAYTHFTVYDICLETIHEAKQLAQQHLNKWEDK